MGTQVKVGGKELTLESEVVQVTKSVSSLPGDIIGGTPSKAKVVSDQITVIADEYFSDAGLNQLNNHRPAANGQAVDGPLGITISEGGNLVFTGELQYVKSSITNLYGAGASGNRHGYDILSDGGILWPSLEGRTLRELDLGTVVWDDTNVIQSWEDTVDNQPGIFAPAIYGAVENGVFDVTMMRYHVYFLPIVKAIFEQLAGFTIESQFLDTELFRSCAHTYGVGDAMVTEPFIPPSPTPSTATIFNAVSVPGVLRTLTFDTVSNQASVGTWSAQSGKFSPVTAGTYTIEVEATYSDLDTIFINKNGSPIASINASGTIATGASSVSLIASDRISLEVTAQSSGQVNTLTVGVSLQESDGAAQIITVSSCLPDEPVKDFLRGVAHLFCWEFGVDSIRRKVVIEPRFPYKIAGVSHPGFYDLINLRDIPGGSDDSRPISVQRLTSYPDQMVLSFKKSTSGLAAYYEKQLPDGEGVPVNGVRLGNGSESTVEKQFPNPYFQAIRARNYQGFSEALALPHLWTQSTGQDEDDTSKFVLGAPSYEHPPSCGLVQRNSTTILWNDTGNPLRAPLLSQSLSFDNVSIPFVLAYGDQATFAPGASVAAKIYPGLGSTFYQHLSASLTRGRLVTMTRQIPNSLEVYAEDFRKGVAMSYDRSSTYPSILLGIKNYQPGGSASLDLLTFVAAGFRDAVSRRSYRLPAIQVEPDGRPCTYTLFDDFPHADSNPDKPITGIALQNGFILPLAYPYKSTVLADADRLQSDLINALQIAGVDAQSVAVSISEGEYNRYSITVSGTTAWLRGVYIRAILLEFETSC